MKEDCKEVDERMKCTIYIVNDTESRYPSYRLTAKPKETDEVIGTFEFEGTSEILELLTNAIVDVRV
jgi:hypothetical protein